MQIKFINTTSLDSKIINIQGATVDEILNTAVNEINDFNKTIIKRNGNIMMFNNYIGDILYYGVPKAEQRRGRKKVDWTERNAKFEKHYSSDKTAKQIADKSGLTTSEVYYIAKQLNKQLAHGKRGRKSSK